MNYQAKHLNTGGWKDGQTDRQHKQNKKITEKLAMTFTISKFHNGILTPSPFAVPNSAASYKMIKKSQAYHTMLFTYLSTLQNFYCGTVISSVQSGGASKEGSGLRYPLDLYIKVGIQLKNLCWKTTMGEAVREIQSRSFNGFGPGHSLVTGCGSGTENVFHTTSNPGLITEQTVHADCWYEHY